MTTYRSTIVFTVLALLAVPALSQAQPLGNDPSTPSTVIISPMVCPSANAAASEAFDEGRRQADMGNLMGAMMAYQNAINLDAAFCDAYDNLGQLYRANGDLVTAIGLYRSSLAIQPVNPVAIQNLALALMLSGDYPGATEQYRTLVAMDAENAEGFYGLGSLLVQLGQNAEAVPSLQRAAELYQAQGSPLVADAYLLLALAHAGMGQCDQSRAFLTGIDLSVYPQGIVSQIQASCPMVP